jgi:hypothetical protein
MNGIMLNDTLASLAMMWKGMLGLFVVCGGIAVLMMVIAKFTTGKDTH